MEDDLNLNDGIKLALHQSDYQISQCTKIEDAHSLFARERIDLILLDINLPDGSGIDFLKKVRLSSDIPIIMISANDLESDIIIGLELGANDYITKPFSLMVLRARVAVQLREKQSSGIFTSEEYHFDFEKMCFYVQNQLTELSKTEQRLLRLLIANRGTVLKRSYLIDEIWAGESEFVDEHALTVTINRLREKLERNPNHSQHITTAYGLGYSWR
ncbi:hypothetical protein A5875_003810 [Enterococcus sp. 3H8_DIV0648]|nr:hypothetical protein A5875_003810 [Enterococcus sp. 3H8_DIV0648]